MLLKYDDLPGAATALGSGLGIYQGLTYTSW